MGFVLRVGVFFGVCCFCFVNTADSVYTGIPKVEVVAGADNFIEDKITKFSCFLPNSTSDQQIEWFIRDPTSRLKTFITNRFLNLLPDSTSGPNGHVFLSLTMRRDFSAADLVCKVKGGTEGVLPLPAIKKTVPIEEVRLTPTDFAVGQKFVVHCDVKSTRSPKVVHFRNLLETFKPTYHSSPSTSWIRYTFDFKKSVTFNPFNNLTCQCQAMTVGLKSEIGNVMTKITALTVHFFQFTSPTSDQKLWKERGKALLLKIEAIANPPPRSDQLVVSRCFAGDSCQLLDSPVQVRIVKRPDAPAKGSTPKMADRKFAFEMLFTPPASGSYRVQFQSRLVNRTSAAFFIDVISLQFFPVKPSYKDNSNLLIAFEVEANPKPRVNEFSVTPANATHNPVQIVSRNLKPLAGSKFAIELTLRSNRSAMLQVVFKSKFLTRVSNHFRVEAWKPAKSNVGIIIIVVVAVVIILSVVVIVIYCWRRNRTDNRENDEKQPEEMPLRVQPVEPDWSPPTRGEVREPNGASSSNSPIEEQKVPPAAAPESKIAPKVETKGIPSPKRLDNERVDKKPPEAEKRDVPVPAPAKPLPPGDSLPPRMLFKVYVPEKAASAKKIPVKTEGKTWSALFAEGVQGMTDTIVFQQFSVTEKFTYISYLRKVPGKKLVQGYFNEHSEDLMTPYTWKKMHFLSEEVKPRVFIRQYFEPVFNVQTKVDFIQISADRQLTVLPFNALCQPQWAVLLPGMRYGEKVFPQLRCERTSNFWRPSKRWVVENEENLVSSEKSGDDVAHEEWRRVYILFQDGDQFPSWDLLQDKVLDIYRRENAKVAVTEGCLKIEQPSTSVTWLQPQKPDELDQLISHPKSTR